MFWQVDFTARCEHHVFLSHCAADRDWLVLAVADQLRQQQIIPWLDQEHYYYGRDSRTALRDGLLKSRHAIFFVTLAMMDYRRGWCPMEAAYANLIQSNLLHAGAALLNYSLPLFFLDRTDQELPRTVWAMFRDRGLFHTPADGDPAGWATARIAQFLRREQALALDYARVIAPGLPSYAALSPRPGLIDRVTRFDPGSIP